MNIRTLLFLLALGFASAASAQWQSVDYTLKGGWNAIYLHGDATHAPPATLFGSEPEVLEVWRWNPNPDQVQFTSSPLIPTGGTEEWKVWKRDGSVTSLTQMIGQSAYLVRCKGTAIATANLSTVSAGTVASITLVDGGSGYGAAPTVTLSPPPTGTTATATATVSAGKVTGFTITNAGSGYIVPPTVTIAPPATQPTHTVSITQKVLPPSANWVRNGANLMGFPTFKNGANYPQFSSYFATFPAAIAANVKIYKYVGGELGAGNPLQVFAPNSERLDRNQAYWFDAEVVGNFYAPVEISLGNASGLDFGRTGSTMTVRVLNRSAVGTTITIASVASNDPPNGQDPLEPFVASVPLTKRTFNSGATPPGWVEEPIQSAYPVTIGPGAAVELSFGIDRGHSSMTGAAANTFFASILRFTHSDSNNPLFQIDLPVRARKASLAGLWVGEAKVGMVESKAAGYTGPDKATQRQYPLRHIIHVDTVGTARLLSQAFIGTLADSPFDFGLCTKEAGIRSTEKATATRIVAAHLPLDRVLDGVVDAKEPLAGSGSVALGGTLVRKVSIPFNDPTNPFVHQYHPDHDNKSPTGAALVAGQESYDITREVTFTFAASAPAGTSPAGYGSSVIAGDYKEVITGLHKDTLTVSGTFELRRISETGVITVNP